MHLALFWISLTLHEVKKVYEKMGMIGRRESIDKQKDIVHINYIFSIFINEMNKDLE